MQHPKLDVAFLWLLVAVSSVNVDALKIREAPVGLPTFQSYYEQASGRGIWKWSNVLDAYQRHFGGLAGRPLSVAEVGVQSGGSLLMWQHVLGGKIKLYGLDINPACKQFAEPNVSITIGDQGDSNMWQGFFAGASQGLDILVDDGGHQAQQMLTTLKSTFPHIHPGGYAVVEGITNFGGELNTFFKPTAEFLSQMAHLGLVDAVHLYPLALVVRKGGFALNSKLASEGTFNVSTINKVPTDSFPAMLTAIDQARPGSSIVLSNSAWGSFFHQDSLVNFFQSFMGLHEAAFTDMPPGCSSTAADNCAMEVNPLSRLQSRVSGVHVYRDYAVVEVPALPPHITAIRKGTKWIHSSR